MEVRVELFCKYFDRNGEFAELDEPLMASFAVVGHVYGSGCVVEYAGSCLCAGAGDCLFCVIDHEFFSEGIDIVFGASRNAYL